MAWAFQSDVVATASFSATGSSFTASFTVVGSNGGRKGLSIYNNSDQVFYVKCGPNASATDFLIRMPSSSFFEFQTPVYTGLISGVYAAAGSGQVQVTEFA